MAGHLTAAQKLAIKNDILANPDLDALPNNSDGAFEIARLYNLPASPDYWVWATSVARADIYNKTSLDGTNWNWATYKNQGATEQNAWVQMFMGDAANFSQVNLRAGIGSIFTGSAPANAQRDHCLASGRRKATRIEKVFAVAVTSPPANTGNNVAHARGASTNPDLLTWEGGIDYQDVLLARNS